MGPDPGIRLGYPVRARCRCPRALVGALAVVSWPFLVHRLVFVPFQPAKRLFQLTERLVLTGKLAVLQGSRLEKHELRESCQ